MDSTSSRARSSFSTAGMWITSGISGSPTRGFLRHAPAPRCALPGNRTAADPAESKYPERRGNRTGQPLVQAKARYRRIEVWVEARQEIMVLVTNHLAFGSTTIAQIYKERWQIEIFFRYLKQNLRIKTFVGTSANALQIQIWTALIAMLLLKYLQLRSSFGWSLSNLTALLRQQLFVYRDLYAWLDHPFQPPPALEGWHDGQLALEF